MSSNKGIGHRGGYHMMGNYNGHMGQGHGHGMLGDNYQGCQGGGSGMYQSNNQRSSRN